jgi:hypothetical protein
MNLSLSVLATILFLTPGFAGYFGMNLAARGRSVRRAAPAPNSLDFLVLVVLCALLAHCVALLAFAIQDLACPPGRCIAIGFDPDAYANLVRLIRHDEVAFHSSSILYELFALFILCGATCLVARAAVAMDMRRGEDSYVAGVLYGWLAPYGADARGGAAAVTAYVLTKLRGDGFAIGYRGIVNEINLTPDKEISSITLMVVERFALGLATFDQAGEHTTATGELLDLVHVPGREIENIVLKLISLDDAEAR